MPYTVWSRGRLIGETDLAYVQAVPGSRAGDFTPSELGERLMPVITGSGDALKALYETSRDIRRGRPGADRAGDWPDGLRQTTEYADAVSICDELESLELELRDPSGAVVKTDWIAVQDTHRLLAASAADDDLLEDVELTEEEQKAIDHDLEIIEAHFAALEAEGADEPWAPDEDRVPRYQILVALAGFDQHMEEMAARRRR